MVQSGYDGVCIGDQEHSKQGPSSNGSHSKEGKRWRSDDGEQQHSQQGTRLKIFEGADSIAILSCPPLVAMHSPTNEEIFIPETHADILEMFPDAVGVCKNDLKCNQGYYRWLQWRYPGGDISAAEVSRLKAKWEVTTVRAVHTYEEESDRYIRIERGPGIAISDKIDNPNMHPTAAMSVCNAQKILPEGIVPDGILRIPDGYLDRRFDRYQSLKYQVQGTDFPEIWPDRLEEDFELYTKLTTEHLEYERSLKQEKKETEQALSHDQIQEIIEVAASNPLNTYLGFAGRIEYLGFTSPSLLCSPSPSTTPRTAGMIKHMKQKQVESYHAFRRKANAMQTAGVAASSPGRDNDEGLREGPPLAGVPISDGLYNSSHVHNNAYHNDQYGDYNAYHDYKGRAYYSRGYHIGEYNLACSKHWDSKPYNRAYWACPEHRQADWGRTGHWQTDWGRTGYWQTDWGCTGHWHADWGQQGQVTQTHGKQWEMHTHGGHHAKAYWETQNHSAEKYDRCTRVGLGQHTQWGQQYDGPSRLSYGMHAEESHVYYPPYVYYPGENAISDIPASEIPMSATFFEGSENRSVSVRSDIQHSVGSDIQHNLRSNNHHAVRSDIQHSERPYEWENGSGPHCLAHVPRERDHFSQPPELFSEASSEKATSSKASRDGGNKPLSSTNGSVFDNDFHDLGVNASVALVCGQNEEFEIQLSKERDGADVMQRVTESCQSIHIKRNIVPNTDATANANATSGDAIFHERNLQNANVSGITPNSAENGLGTNPNSADGNTSQNSAKNGSAKRGETEVSKTVHVMEIDKAVLELSSGEVVKLARNPVPQSQRVKEDVKPQSQKGIYSPKGMYKPIGKTAQPGTYGAYQSSYGAYGKPYQKDALCGAYRGDASYGAYDSAPHAGSYAAHRDDFGQNANGAYRDPSCSRPYVANSKNPVYNGKTPAIGPPTATLTLQNGKIMQCNEMQLSRILNVTPATARALINHQMASKGISWPADTQQDTSWQLPSWPGDTSWQEQTDFRSSDRRPPTDQSYWPPGCNPASSSTAWNSPNKAWSGPCHEPSSSAAKGLWSGRTGSLDAWSGWSRENNQNWSAKNKPAGSYEGEQAGWKAQTGKATSWKTPIPDGHFPGKAKSPQYDHTNYDYTNAGFIDQIHWDNKNHVQEAKINGSTTTIQSSITNKQQSRLNSLVNVSGMVQQTQNFQPGVVTENFQSRIGAGISSGGLRNSGGIAPGVQTDLARANLDSQQISGPTTTATILFGQLNSIHEEIATIHQSLINLSHVVCSSNKEYLKDLQEQLGDVKNQLLRLNAKKPEGSIHNHHENELQGRLEQHPAARDSAACAEPEPPKPPGNSVATIARLTPISLNPLAFS